jgi:hypothetical protein
MSSETPGGGVTPYRRQALDECVSDHSSYDNHRCLLLHESAANFYSYALVQTRYHDRCPPSGVVAGTYFEVWEEDPGGAWELVDPDAHERTDLRDYDESYNPTPVEILAGAYTNNEKE